MSKRNITRKYAPKTLKGVKGQKECVLRLKNILRRGIFPHICILGKPGTGKTTAANAFVYMVKKGKVTDYNYRKFNASHDRGIDFVRGLKRLASVITREIIFVLLDEADGMTPEALNAMRWTMEHTKNVVFILTANIETKVIDAIKSRCTVLRFKPLPKDDMADHIFTIIGKEGIRIEGTKESLDAIDVMLEDANGDMRSLLNTFESLINEKGVITEKSLVTMRRAKRGRIILQKAVSGDIDTARRMLDKAYAEGEGSRIADEWYKTIPDLEVSIEIRELLFSRLSDYAYRARGATNPLIDLGGFLSFAWVVRFVPLNPIILSNEAS